ADPGKTEVASNSELTSGVRVWWTYEVENDGTGALLGLVIADDSLPDHDEVCVIAKLAHGARAGCAASDRIARQ
ncbi:MAG: hypothetical protein LBT54_03880, partial [Bifidobacteriaceae bacterium]|nr:hypothetical protein [Bifidobacteriaceae bacterium]